MPARPTILQRAIAAQLRSVPERRAYRPRASSRLPVRTRVLRHLHREPWSPVREIRVAVEATDGAVRTVLAGLVEQGRVMRERRGRTWLYRVPG